MSEAIRNLTILIWAACAFNSPAYAQNRSGIVEEKPVSAPTIVTGAAATPDGGQNTFTIEQPQNGPNPLGDPIPNVSLPRTPQDADANLPTTTSDAVPTPTNTTQMPSGSLVREATPQQAQQLGKDFQNTLLEANVMVYDVQAYPEADLPVIGNPSQPETIYSPNVNNP